MGGTTVQSFEGYYNEDTEVENGNTQVPLSKQAADDAYFWHWRICKRLLYATTEWCRGTRENGNALAGPIIDTLREVGKRRGQGAPMGHGNIGTNAE